MGNPFSYNGAMLLLPIILGCEPIPAATTLHEGDADADSDADTDSDADGDDADDTASAWPLEMATDFDAAIDGDDVDFFRVSGTAGGQFRVQVVNSDEYMCSRTKTWFRSTESRSRNAGRSWCSMVDTDARSRATWA